jgi:hypothetical protein
MFDNGRKNKLHNFQTLLHPPTHTACRPQCGLPLASPSLSLGQKPKTGLPTQAQAVLTPPKTTTEASSRFLFVFLPDCYSFYDDLKIIKKKFIACFLKCKSAFVFCINLANQSRKFFYLLHLLISGHIRKSGGQHTSIFSKNFYAFSSLSFLTALSSLAFFLFLFVNHCHLQES